MPHHAFRYPSAGSLAHAPTIEEAITQARRHPDGGVPPQQQFCVKLDFQPACAIDRACRVIVYLDGYLGYEVI